MKRQPADFIPHLERYVFAANYCSRQRVIDLGSKTGYGSYIMGYFAKKITLVDYKSDLIAGAKKQSFPCVVDFLEMDLNEDYPKGEWDMAVAFEIIEHVKDPDQFVKNIADHLPSGGQLVFSVPHMKPHQDHLTLFDKDKITVLISKYFILEELYWQGSYGISNTPFGRYPKTHVGVGRKL